MSSSTEFMIDGHCHLADPAFVKDLDEVIEKAKQTGVRGIVVVPEFPPDFPRVLEIADRHPDIILPCLGLHPVQKADEEGKFRSVTLQEFEGVLPLIEENQEKIGAVGEVGLDFTPKFCTGGEEDKRVQREVFRQQIELAKKFDLPVNVHSRSAGRPTITWLKEHGAEKVLLHAFDGKASVAMEGVQAGYYFSIPPMAVRNQSTQKLIKTLPIESLILETDSPVLGHEKDVRNVPANVAVSCDLIANIKNMDPNDVKKITSENAIKLFPRLKEIISG